MLYLIAKIEIIMKLSHEIIKLKHEIILCQKEKRSKMFQVKAIRKDVRKTIVPSFMFLFNLSKSAILCVNKCKYNTIFTTEPMKSQINIHDFLVRSLCFIESERSLLF